MKPMKPEEVTRIVASARTRYDYHRVYKYYNDPTDWRSNGGVQVSCQDGKVSVKIFEKDTINIHEVEIWSEDGKCKTRLTEQITPPEE